MNSVSKQAGWIAFLIFMIVFIQVVNAWLVESRVLPWSWQDWRLFLVGSIVYLGILIVIICNHGAGARDMMVIMVIVWLLAFVGSSGTMFVEFRCFTREEAGNVIQYAELASAGLTLFIACLIGLDAA